MGFGGLGNNGQCLQLLCVQYGDENYLYRCVISGLVAIALLLDNNNDVSVANCIKIILGQSLGIQHIDRDGGCTRCHITLVNECVCVYVCV